MLLRGGGLDLLYSIDRWSGDRGHDDKQYLEALEKLLPYSPVSVVMKRDFVSALDLIPDGSLDFVYIDGYAHDGNRGGKTFEDWFPKVRIGGLIGGHDYSDSWAKNKEAVDGFLQRRRHQLGEPFFTTADKHPSWFAEKVATPFRRQSIESQVDQYRNLSGQPAGLFLCMNGPSMGAVDLAKLRQPGIVTMGVNNGGHVLRPNLWTFVDAPHRFMESIWKDPLITKFVPTDFMQSPTWNHAREDYGTPVVDCPNVVSYPRNHVFNAATFLTEPTFNYGNDKARGNGRSVMLPALRLAYVLGFRRVYLLGCDFTRIAPPAGQKKPEPMEDGYYFFHEQRSSHSLWGCGFNYDHLERYFEELKPVFAAADFQVFNCTTGSGLRALPQFPLGKALMAHRISTDDETHGMYVDRKP